MSQCNWQFIRIIRIQTVDVLSYVKQHCVKHSGGETKHELNMRSIVAMK